MGHKKVTFNRRNPVAKNLREVNKAQTHIDRKSDYKRKPKHTKSTWVKEEIE